MYVFSTEYCYYSVLRQMTLIFSGTEREEMLLVCWSIAWAAGHESGREALFFFFFFFS